MRGRIIVVAIFACILFQACNEEFSEAVNAEELAILEQQLVVDIINVALVNVRKGTQSALSIPWDYDSDEAMTMSVGNTAATDAYSYIDSEVVFQEIASLALRFPASISAKAEVVGQPTVLQNRYDGEITWRVAHQEHVTITGIHLAMSDDEGSRASGTVTIVESLISQPYAIVDLDLLLLGQFKSQLGGDGGQVQFESCGKPDVTGLYELVEISRQLFLYPCDLTGYGSPAPFGDLLIFGYQSPDYRPYSAVVTDGNVAFYTNSATDFSSLTVTDYEMLSDEHCSAANNNGLGFQPNWTVPFYGPKSSSREFSVDQPGLVTMHRVNSGFTDSISIRIQSGHVQCENGLTDVCINVSNARAEKDQLDLVFSDLDDGDAPGHIQAYINWGCRASNSLGFDEATQTKYVELKFEQESEDNVLFDHCAECNFGQRLTRGDLRLVVETEYPYSYIELSAKEVFVLSNQGVQ